MFDRDQLHAVFNLAETFRQHVAEEKPLDHILRGKLMVALFYEVSTRTLCSFDAAMQRLGGRVITVHESTSSVKKGEAGEAELD